MDGFSEGQKELMSKALKAAGLMIEEVRLMHQSLQPGGADLIDRTPLSLAQLIGQDPMLTCGDHELPEHLEVADAALRSLIRYLSNGTVRQFGHDAAEMEAFLEDASRVFESVTRRVQSLCS